MKKILIFGLLFLSLTMTINAQSDDTKKTDDTEQTTVGPKMELEKTIVDYGTIQKGSDPLRTVVFTNTGIEPLVISNARGSCGCTVPTWPREPIMPGESSVIEIRYDTKRIGNFNKKVTLTTNEVGIKKHIIKIKGKVLVEKKQENLPEKAPNMLSPE